MAGAPGADHAFVEDIENASFSTMMADMATLNLQILHAMGNGIPEGNRAFAAEIGARSQRILDASKVSQSREASTRELRPLTKVPAVPWGNQDQIHNIKLHNVPSFTGSSTDTLDVVRWLSRILTLAKANRLTFDAASNLLVLGSSGGAADYIEQMRDEGNDIFRIVQLLEMRYGDLCTPEEARVRTNNMARKEKEGLSEFIDRLRAMARIACRLIDDEPARKKDMEFLVESNIRRALPTSVRNALQERVTTRSTMGLPAFTAREIEKECLDLEKRRDERKTQLHAYGAAKHRGQIHHVKADTSDDSNSSGDEADIDIEDVGTYHLVNEVRQVQKDYARRNKIVEPQRMYRKAFRNFNNKFPAKNQRGQHPYGARQVGQGVNVQGQSNPNHGPPNALGGQHNKNTYELLALANIQKGSCIQCGQQGHYLQNDKCALRDRPLMDKACAKCGQGLHSADDCLKVFQKQYVAQQPQDAKPDNLNQDQLKGN